MNQTEIAEKIILLLRARQFIKESDIASGFSSEQTKDVLDVIKQMRIKGVINQTQLGFFLTNKDFQLSSLFDRKRNNLIAKWMENDIMLIISALSAIAGVIGFIIWLASLF